MTLVRSTPITAARERAFTISQVPAAKHAVVIFGFGVPERATPTIELKRRLGNAIAELDEDPNAIAVVTGNAVYTPDNEADAMKRWLIDHGIEPHRIILERTARYTAENASFVAPILKRAGVERVTLVTERYHMHRSARLLKRALEAEGLDDLPIKTLAAPDEHNGWQRLPAMKREMAAFSRDLWSWSKNRENLPYVEAEFKVPVVRLDTADDTAKRVAEEIAAVIRERHDHGGAVLGLATGSTPLAVYRELIRMHREEGLDFSRVKTFNLDEYYGLKQDDPNSYHRYMHENLFHHLDQGDRAIDLANVRVPPGDVPRSQIGREVEAYEQAIRDAGGIDIQLLGIGATGHIGFNEPGSEKDSTTRLVQLAQQTRRDAAGAFGGEALVPKEAITMGVGTILAAKRVILMATGEHKANITRRAVEGTVTTETPATFLQDHPNVQFFVDELASQSLARVLPRDLLPVGREGMSYRAIYSRKVLLPTGDGTFETRPALLLIENGMIASVFTDPKPHEIPADARRVNGLIAPGFVDLQNNGSYGADVTRDPVHAMETLVRRAPEQGVTTVLPTVVSSPAEVATSAFEAVERVRDLPGADIPGVHLEGPYFNPARVGAHAPEQVRPVDLGELRALIEASKGQLKILTLAPELPNALAAIDLSVASGVVPSAGHTNASHAQMKAAQRHDLHLITHITNAMPKDLEDGLIQAVLEDPDAVAGVIADGIHVKPELMRALYERLGPQRMMLVTDASPPAGMPDGAYTLGGMAVEKKDGAVRLAGTDTLAGSALTMDRAIVQTMQILGIDVEEAVLMASDTPAQAGRLGERGRIAARHRADFAILDPRTLEVRETIVGGVTRYDRAARDDQ